MKAPWEGSRRVVRPPAVSGRFYPSDARELAAAVDRLIAEADVNAPPGAAGATPRGPVGIVVPHAGYMYSGAVAARAWSRARERRPDVIVLVGPDHFTGYPYVAIYGHGAFGTPLGPVPVDEDLAAALASSGGPLVERPEVHEREHSLEVQTPFVRRLFPGVPIVPILMGHRSAENVESLSDALATHLAGRRALLVASSDLSHYHARERAAVLDALVRRRIDEMNPQGLGDDLAAGRAEACGGDAIVTVLDAAGRLGAVRGSVLQYADSGAVNGDTGSVVGYLAAALEDAPPVPPEGLTPEEERHLLSLARNAVLGAARGEPERFTEADLPRALNRLCGAFVTLRKDGTLRGCVGFNRPIHPLARTVFLAARAAVLEDTRFQQVSADEVESLEIEISVLGDLKPAHPDEITIGRHGLLVSQGVRRGLLLPQVALEHGWGPAQFLSETCRKAGLPPDAWERGARIEIFETFVIPGGA